MLLKTASIQTFQPVFVILSCYVDPGIYGDYPIGPAQ